MRMIKERSHVFVSHAAAHDDKGGLGEAVSRNSLVEILKLTSEDPFLRPCSLIDYGCGSVLRISSLDEILLEFLSKRCA